MSKITSFSGWLFFFVCAVKNEITHMPETMCVCAHLTGSGVAQLWSCIASAAAWIENRNCSHSGYRWFPQRRRLENSSGPLAHPWGSVLLWCVRSCQRSQWNKLNSDAGPSEVPVDEQTLYSFLLNTLVRYFVIWPNMFCLCCISNLSAPGTC